MYRLQHNLPEQPAQQLRRLLRAPLQELAERRNARLDPGERRNAEDRLPGSLESLDLDGEPVRQGPVSSSVLATARPGSALPQAMKSTIRVTRRRASSSCATFRESISGTSERRRFGLHAHALEDVPESLRAKHLLPDSSEDEVLGTPPRNPDAVVAGSPRGGKAAVMAAALAADETDVATTAAADHRAAEQMRREHGHTRRPGGLVPRLEPPGQTWLDSWRRFATRSQSSCGTMRRSSASQTRHSDSGLA